ncbi:glycosyltransferase [Thiothrix winogradskyi]|uniref:Glycosyltransferase n=1 Tax=Thiothrix winogradskyi TaxID=96472 RepID=A0ABY3T1M8_9GAMM|nr:glycosyltransferase [Thiothrix winogradskyi]UJS25732.1 glycosyltransferase [Thiothrix winogradskyi]
MVKVSVILPVYNHARWVQQALDSVLAQTFSAFELIVIDDASTDDSWAVIQTACATKPDARVRCWRHEHNQGAPATLNEGLRLAQGEYLAILNSDDVWDVTRLQRLVTLAQSQSLDFISTDVAVLDADSQPKEAAEPHWVAWFEGLKQYYATHTDTQATLLRGNFLITTSNFFFHRRVYAQLGGFSELRYVHDYEYALRVVAAGFKVRFLSGEKLLGYRLHESNTIREKPLAAIEENMHLLLGWLGGRRTSPPAPLSLTGEGEEEVVHSCSPSPVKERGLGGEVLLGLSSQLQDLYRYTREEWLTIVHQRLVAREQELLPLIQDRDAWIAERDQLIGELQQHLAQHRQWLVERDGWISARDAWIVERDTLLQQQAAALVDRDRWIAERDAWIRERDVFIQHLQHQQQALLNGRAFRLGEALLSPLRRCKQWWRGGELCLKS